MPSLEDNRAEVDAAVVKNALLGDKSALAQIYDTYARSIYRYHVSRTGNAPEAEDLTAQTFLAMIEALPRYHHRGHFSAWIFQIARNKAMDFFRKNHLQASLDFSLVDLNSGELIETVIDRQAYQHLGYLLRQLNEEERELIRLRFVAELSFVEIAALLGRKEDAVRKALKRLLERLYSQMEVQNA